MNLLTATLFRFKEKYMKAMDNVAASIAPDTSNQKIDDSNVGNKMLQVTDMSFRKITCHKNVNVGILRCVCTMHNAPAKIH